MKMSEHSKKRMRERTDYNHKERKLLFREALDKGKSPNDIKDEEIKKYLLSKPKCKTKLYKGYVFIYSKNSKQLYTMYKLPEKLYKKRGERNGFIK